MNKKWVIKNSDSFKIQEIESAFGISPILAALLANRNFAKLSDVDLFLKPELAKMHNPFLLPDMEKAVVRVRRAVDMNEKIMVFGDKDVDGVTSVAILVRTLQGIGAETSWELPLEKEHGLGKLVLEKASKEGVKLVLTVDCGTSQIEEIAYANSLGIDVIVTDHHLPPEILPPAYAIVNPNLKNSLYPSKELAGCLTAFKFAYALMFSFNRAFGHEYIVLDLETTGLSHLNDGIVEVGAVCIRNFVPVAQFHTLVCPHCPISAGAMRVHGINAEMVEDAPSIEEILPKLLEFIGGRTVVAHNARFDLSFLQSAVKRHIGTDFNPPMIDTLSLSREYLPFQSHALTSLAKELKIEMVQAHRSMDDCYAAAEVFKRIEEARDPRLRFFLEEMLDLVTLGTIADVVPLVGENRIVVKHGLNSLLKTKKVGLKKLCVECGINGENMDQSFTAKELAWKVTPILNAAGRFAKAELSVRLLLTNRQDDADALIRELIALNQTRKDLQKVNSEKFLELAVKQTDLENDRLLFVVADRLGYGVTGIVASRLAHLYGRPVVLLISDGTEATGSCRSVPDFNLVEALQECEDLLVRYGGHAQAAGLTVESKNIERLREKLKSIAENRIGSELLSPQIEIDMELKVNDITPELLNEMALIEPFGEGNPAPIFCLKNAEIARSALVGSDKSHLKLCLDRKKQLSAIGWGMGLQGQGFKPGETADLVFQLEWNRWDGKSSPQLLLLDIRKSESEISKESYYYEEIK